MTEAEEIAESLRVAWGIFLRHQEKIRWLTPSGHVIIGIDWTREGTLDLAREFVKSIMKGETEQLYDNIAEALINQRN